MGERAVGALIVAIVGLTACSGAAKTAAPGGTTPPSAGGSEITTKLAPTSARPSPTTTTSTPEFSFDDSVPPPKLVDTGTDYAAIAESLGQYGNWLSAHRPDPSLATRVVAPGTQLLYFFSRDLMRLRDNGKRLIEKVRGPGIYTVISAKPDAVSLRAQESIRFHETVDASGTVTSLAPYPEHSNSLVLIVLVGGRWRFAAYDPEQPPVNVHL